MFRMAAVVILACAFASSAAAQSVCFPDALMDSTLKDRFSEELVASGTTEAGSVMKVYASPPTGFTVNTWTMVLSIYGRSCVLASGKNWQGRELPGAPI